MLPSRIPVRVFAADSDEYQAFSDVLGHGQSGALALCADDETPVVGVVCPSGDVSPPAGIPLLYLGRTGDVPDKCRSLPVPALMVDVLAALEILAQESIDFSAPRHCGGWTLDPMRLSVRPPEGPAITLTDTETRLLVILFEAMGRDMDRDELLQRVWGYRPGLDTHTLETHIYRLRQKIEASPTAPAFLMTTDLGYRLAVPR